MLLSVMNGECRSVKDKEEKASSPTPRQRGRIRDVDLLIREMDNPDETLVGDEDHRKLEWRINCTLQKVISETAETLNHGQSALVELDGFLYPELHVIAGLMQKKNRTDAEEKHQ
ncbi:hypothetical protein L2E82_37448 [Cichorium intybus]|uniref:Uncharacterized protein n=1 Tax=Cichorium intybus TaxID=13427 RepID=A0ACB9AEI9_CICIN|nr:hypothetical protein L2E82_37448 [Cichorium intybus]